MLISTSTTLTPCSVMKRSSAPTLYDVACRAGVSTATASRALTAPTLVSASTCELVMRAVDELGYTSHFGGRAPASKRSNTVGAVIPTIYNAIFRQPPS